MAKYKHLTMSERIEIYSLLKEDKSIRKIAKALNRDPTIVAKEIKKHLEVKETGCGGRPFNQCKNSDRCKKYKFAEQNGVMTFVINAVSAIPSAMSLRSRFAREM